MIDWSLCENQDWLRDQADGHERDLAHIMRGAHVDEFCSEAGMGEYTHNRFIDWVAESYPATLHGIMLALAESAVEVLKRGPDY